MILLFVLNSMIFAIDAYPYTMIKTIGNDTYVGGRNFLAIYDLIKKTVVKKEVYEWSSDIMNGSDIGFDMFIRDRHSITLKPKLLVFDTCLNWKQEHLNSSQRDLAFDYQHWKYHTPSGDFITMNFSCMNSFIKAVEPLDEEKLWVCGTFGAFPRAFSVNKTTLKFIQFVDINMMSCARYVDEPMATFRDKNNNLYIASGWGLYRPDKTNPDIPNNNSTMMYSDWRLFRNLFTLPSAMAWVLSSDVNFINVVKETENHLYFFGHEINNQYGLNNQEDRNAWQSFMLRICKGDLGFKYVPVEVSPMLKYMTNEKYHLDALDGDYYIFSPLHENMDHNSLWYEKTVHLPTKHFVTPLKLNFGCYLGKRPRAISDNYFWGQTNVIYFNQLADVIFDPNRKIKFSTKDNNPIFGCRNESHSQIPLVGIFNNPGIQGTMMKPSGALCQLQINENIFKEIGFKKSPYHRTNQMNVNDAFEEIMALSSTSNLNFYSRSLHRTNGFTLYPFWNQGVLIGDHVKRPYYKNAFDHSGTCENSSFYQNMNVERFVRIQNFSNTAWPNELPNRLSSILSSVCQYSAAELYSFNATFILKDVEFKKIFLIKDNITNYQMDSDEGRQNTSPLMIVIIISTHGHLYRVVLCDFDNGMLNHGEDKSRNEWYNWCIFRHTDQPYLYRQYAPMERREWGESYQFRASSLLSDKVIVKKVNEKSFPINRDPQFHIVKDVLRKDDFIFVLTSTEIIAIDLEIKCTENYSTCIDCASDPECMWNVKEKMCESYNLKKYKNSGFVQDVLDRGFMCAQHIETRLIYVSLDGLFSMTNSNIFECFNIGFWRDQIQWKVNNVDLEFIDTFRGNLIYTKDNYLIVKKGGENIQNFSCYGIRSDHDKLYYNTEYKWINELKSPQILTVYINGKSTKYFLMCWIIITILLVIILIIVSVCCLILFCNKNKRQRSIQAKSEEIAHLTETKI